MNGKEAPYTKVENLDGEFAITFKKRQWVLLYNLIVLDETTQRPRMYALGDAKIMNEICDKIQKEAQLSTPQTPTSEEGVVVN